MNQHWGAYCVMTPTTAVLHPPLFDTAAGAGCVWCVCVRTMPPHKEGDTQHSRRGG